MKRNLNGLKIISIIPARSGSKSIPDKNIQSLFGKPLFTHSIKHSFQSNYIQRTIVSTDSEQYAEIARSHAAEVPFLRPQTISADHSTDLEVFEHAIKWLKDNENYIPDIIVHLRPTTPVRRAEDIDEMIELLLANPDADSIRSVVKNPEPVYKMWFMSENRTLIPVIHDPNIPEAYNLPRQGLRESYTQNASVDVTRSATILGKKSMTGHRILGFEMEKSFDIDFRHQFDNISAADFLLESKLTFVFDIDGVVALLSPNNDYNLAKPNLQVIEKINKLYDHGHTIILYTARGSKTKLDWHKVTSDQMASWGVKYNELRLGKPFGDYYVDDRMLSINDILNLKL